MTNNLDSILKRIKQCVISLKGGEGPLGGNEQVQTEFKLTKRLLCYCKHGNALEALNYVKTASSEMEKAIGAATLYQNVAQIILNKDRGTAPTSPGATKQNGPNGEALKFTDDGRYIIIINRLIGDEIKSITYKQSQKVYRQMSDRHHSFPLLLDKVILENSERTVEYDYYRMPKSGMSHNTAKYRLPGSLLGENEYKSGHFEIFTRISDDGLMEEVMHHFFRKDIK